MQNDLTALYHVSGRLEGSKNVLMIRVGAKGVGKMHGKKRERAND